MSVMKDMLEDIVKNRMGHELKPKKVPEIMSLEEYSDKDPILAKWVLLVKELWMERENEDRVTILTGLIKDINFQEVDPNIKNILINRINGE